MDQLVNHLFWGPERVRPTIDDLDIADIRQDLLNYLFLLGKDIFSMTCFRSSFGLQVPRPDREDKRDTGLGCKCNDDLWEWDQFEFRWSY